MENKNNNKPVIKKNNEKSKKIKNLKTLNKTKLFYGISGTAIGVLTITSIAVPTAITNNKNKEIRKITLQKNNFDSKRKTLESNYKKLDTDKKTLESNYKKLDTDKKTLESNYKKLDTDKKRLESNYRAGKNFFIGSFANKAIEKSFLEAKGVLKGKQAWRYQFLESGFHSWDGVTLKNIKGKTELESIILPKVTKIEDTSVFADTHIKEIYLPAVTEIGNWTFTGANIQYGITTKILSFGNIKTVGTGAFQGAYLLESLDLSTATSIGGHAFRYCEMLKNIDLSSWTDKTNMRNAVNLFYGTGNKDTSKPVTITLSKKVQNYPELESFKKLWFSSNNGVVPDYVKFKFK